MDSAAARAANAAYQNHQKRTRPRLQSVQEHPWETDPSYCERLRKPASPETFRGPPWRPSHQDTGGASINRPTPTQMLDSILGAPSRVPDVRERRVSEPSRDPQRERQLVLASNATRDRNAPANHREQRLVRRQTPQQQRPSQGHPQARAARRWSSPAVPVCLPPPVPRSHVPPDLVEGARVLRQAGIVLPVQGALCQTPQPQAQVRRAITAPSASELAASMATEAITGHDRLSYRNPVPGDLLESMGRLRFHDMIESAVVGNGVMLPEMPNSTITDIAGSNYELLAVADSVVKNRIPHSRIAVAGLSGSGKTHCLQLFLTRVRMRAPSMNMLKIDLSDPGAIHLDNEALHRLQTCSSLEGADVVLRSLGLPSPALAMVVIEGMNRPEDADVVQSWCHRFFQTDCCVLVTTRRTDIAKSFAAGDEALIYALSALSPWMATYLLHTTGTSSMTTNAIARQLSYHPAAIVGAAKLMRDTGMRPDDLSAHLSRLISAPNRKDDTSTRLALETASGLIGLSSFEKRPWLDKDASALFAILVHCVQRSWLDVFSATQRECPAAMMVIGVLSALGKDELDERLIGKIQQMMGSTNAIRMLQAHSLVTAEENDGEKRYRCPFPVLMAAQMWMVSHGVYEDAFTLANSAIK